MLRLIESRRPRPKSRGATLFSVLAHTAIIGGALASTATGEQKQPLTVTDPHVIFVPTRTTVPPSRAPRLPQDPSRLPSPPVILSPDIPTTIPDPGTPLPAPAYEPPGPLGPVGPVGPNGPGVGIPDSAAMLSDQVDRPVVQKGRVRPPRYPDALRINGREGSVVAFFVVDTLGRVEPESFRAAATSHALFTAAVRASVLEMRFTPAESGGRRVRQLVEQRFLFELRQ